MLSIRKLESTFRYSVIVNFTQEPSSYLAKPRKKDYYDSIYRILIDNSIQHVLDIGTASGDFLHFLPPEISGTGLDSSEELISFANASRSRDNLVFVRTRFEDFRASETYDAVTICGTLPTMEDWKVTLCSIIELNPKIILIHDAFNPFDVDIKLGYKYSNSLDQDFNFAYNIISISNGYNFRA